MRLLSPTYYKHVNIKLQNAHVWEKRQETRIERALTMTP
jgi:hypothetical protein